MQDNRYEDIQIYDTPAYKPRKKRWGDRKEGRRIRKLPALNLVSPFIMKERNDSQNFFEDVIDVTNIENYLDEKRKQGYTDLSFLHVLLASYARVISERPSINRFLAGQRIYARNNIECVMIVKKEMSIESEETSVKVVLDPRDNVLNVYKKFQKTVKDALETSSDFDKTAGFLTKVPRPILRTTIRFLKWLDYHGWLPKSLMNVSPFHGSMIVTSMGSLGIPAIYHHLYDFGTLPVFLSYGSIYADEIVKRDGSKEIRRFITFKVVCDERICDGYAYASAFKLIKKYLLHPELLDKTPDTVTEDID